MRTYRGVANMPGPGGSLGMCALCGDTFMLEILLGRNVQTVEIEGFDKDVCLHLKCVEVLEKNGSDWRTLPDGPLRRAYEKAASTTDSLFLSSDRAEPSK
jgi:hypothetical protein